jgi:hypothetical protein
MKNKKKYKCNAGSHLYYIFFSFFNRFDAFEVGQLQL